MNANVVGKTLTGALTELFGETSKPAYYTLNCLRAPKGRRRDQGHKRGEDGDGGEALSDLVVCHAPRHQGPGHGVDAHAEKVQTGRQVELGDEPAHGGCEEIPIHFRRNHGDVASRLLRNLGPRRKGQRGR